MSRGDTLDLDRRRRDREVAAIVRARVDVGALADALGLVSDLGAACPCCGHFGARLGKAFACDACGATLDAIALYQAARGVGFFAAIRELTEFMARPRCGRTGDLFGRR